MLAIFGQYVDVWNILCVVIPAVLLRGGSVILLELAMMGTIGWSIHTHTLPSHLPTLLT